MLGEKFFISFISFNLLLPKTDPIVISCAQGGLELIHPDSEKDLNKLRPNMTDYGSEMLIRVTSCILARKRAGWYYLNSNKWRRQIGNNVKAEKFFNVQYGEI